MPLHLYFHLPYCRRKCPYCDFFKRVPRAGERERFVDALLMETRRARECYSTFSGPLTTIYFGGGTPSLHPPQEIAALIDCAQNTWGIIEHAEITLEANPGTLTPDVLAGWRAAGVNRLSLGGQSFSERKLKLLYRDHSADEIFQAVELARNAGFENLSLDLIFGLPDETLDEWRADVEQAADLAPEHVSLYNLEFHEGTPFDRWRAEGKLVPLDEDVEADLYLFTHDYLAQRGYEHYEVSNFARAGYRAVHNSAYWQGKPYLGCGPSAHSFDGDRRRFFNKADLHAYFSDIEAGHMPVGGEQIQSPQEKREEWISLSLRRSDGIQRSAALSVLGVAATRALWQRATELPGPLRVISEERLSLSAEGWFRENSVLLFLFEGLEALPAGETS